MIPPIFLHASNSPGTLVWVWVTPPSVCLHRELGFEGVPFRETVMVLPTVNCLVELTQMPFTVVSLGDIEIVNLERVGFNLKNFDMAIVFKVQRVEAATVVAA